MGWGNNGWNRNGEGNGSSGSGGSTGAALTRGELCQDMNFQDISSSLRGLTNGMCDSFYTQNTNLLNGFSGIDNAICTLGYQVQQGFNASDVAALQGQNALATQLASCCCNTQDAIKTASYDNLLNQNAITRQISDCCCSTERQIERGFSDVNYNMATNTCSVQTAINGATRDIIDSQNAGTRAILDYLCQEKISDLQNENQALRLAASQQAQNSYLVSELAPKLPVPSYPVPNPFVPYGYGGCGNCGCACA